MISVLNVDDLEVVIPIYDSLWSDLANAHHITHVKKTTDPYTGEIPLQEPVKGTTTLAEVANATAAPNTGPVEYIPDANPRSFPINQSETTFGAPMDMIGPPNPNMETVISNSKKLSAHPLNTKDINIKNIPTPSDFRTPNLSTKYPSGYAVNMYINCHVPRTKPICP